MGALSCRLCIIHAIAMQHLSHVCIACLLLCAPVALFVVMRVWVASLCWCCLSYLSSAAVAGRVAWLGACGSM